MSVVEEVKAGTGYSATVGWSREQRVEHTLNSVLLF